MHQIVLKDKSAIWLTHKSRNKVYTYRSIFYTALWNANNL